MKSARVVLLWRCDKACPGCCNAYGVMAEARMLNYWSELKDYDNILLTGGEPMLEPQELLDHISAIRHLLPTKKIYLYTALYRPALFNVMREVDGIHFTLHQNISAEQLSGFKLFQNWIYDHPTLFSKKSFRLYIDPENDAVVPIRPRLWKRVEIKPWIPDGECPLPEGESLFIYNCKRTNTAEYLKHFRKIEGKCA